MRNFFDCESDNTWNNDATEYSNKNILAAQEINLKKIYDFSDYVYDIRMLEQHDIQNLLLGLIEKLCNQPNHCLTRQEDDTDFSYILYQITFGNVCLRLNQLYLNLYNYEASDKWYQRAIEAFWTGKNQTYDELDSKPDNETLKMYKYLLMLSIGKCYRNFAIQNRRSDFTAAEDRFHTIAKDLKDMPKDRRLVMIYLDALINLAKIKRLRYNFLEAEEAYNEFSDAFQNAKDKLYDKDTARFQAQLGVERGLLWRKERDTNALNFFFQVAQESYVSTANKPSDYNVDAINNLSSSLRKIKDNAKQVEAYQKYVQTLTFCVYSINPENSTLESAGLLGQLRYYAHEGNMYALREYVQWYAIYLSDHSNSTAKLLIQSEYAGTDMTTEPLTTGRAITSLGLGLDYILRNGERIKENIKDYFQYTLSNIARQLDALIIRFPLKKESADADNKKKYTIEKWQQNIERNKRSKKTKNLQLQYLKCVFFSHLGCYSMIHDTLLELCARKELDYIRRGTHGLKVRYLLAKDYMASGLYEHAADVLEEIRNELQAQHLLSQTPSQTNSDKIDISTELSYGACLMQLGRYKDAQQKVYANADIIEKVKYLSADLIITDKYYADYALCLIHQGDINGAQEKFKALRNQTSRDFHLLCGYFKILSDTEDITKYEQASENFKKAYETFYERTTYRHHLMEIDNKLLYPEPNKMELLKETECRTAYIITLIKLWEIADPNDKEKCQDKIIRFVVDVPCTASLSLHAMFQIAHWIREYEEGSTHSNANNPEKKRQIIKRLYQSFAKCEVYPERGARAFQELKDSSKFRYFQAEQRGRILVHLFCIYMHIKWIKGHLCLTAEGLEGNKKIVHYTKVDTLKALLHIPASGETTPRFRVSNCGYMNDVFEGNVFLEMLAKPEEPAALQKSAQQTIDQYFPQWKSNEPKTPLEGKSLVPLAKNVYIASFSTDADNFAMWSIYSKDETGCTIQFEERFFDIRDENKTFDDLKSYFISRYTDNDYPLYRVQYLKKNEADGEYDIVKQPDDTGKLKDEDLKEQINALRRDLALLEECLAKEEGNGNQKMQDSIKYIRSFTANRLDEVRFLFKTSVYSYEQELRLVVTTKEGKIDDVSPCPRTYAEILRDIEGITVTLGSKIDAITVDRLVTWMTQTGKVKAVMHSDLNWPV